MVRNSKTTPATPAATTATTAQKPRAKKATQEVTSNPEPVNEMITAPLATEATEVPTVVSKMSEFSSKLQQLVSLFSTVKSDFKTLEKSVAREMKLAQKAYTKNFTIFGLPFIRDNLKMAFSKINEIPYPVKGILFRNLNDTDAAGLILNNRQPIKECIFKIRAEISQDIYNLYCKGYGKDSELYGLACIPDYKTSVMMNKHFRLIRENANLDLLEMSEGEEEFENISDDRYVNLKKVMYMKCVYMKKFRKWKPIEVVNFGEKLLTKREIQQLER